MESLKTRAKSFRFHDPRQERIYRRLILIGPGPASFFRDACQIASGERPFDTSTHLVGHLLREIESALRDVLEVFTDRSERIKNGKEKHKAEIKSILHALNISEEDSVAQAWLRMAIEGDNWAFHMRAHRNSLAPPRSIDKDFRDWWNDIQKVFDAILERFESHYLKFYQVLDDLIKIESPARKDAEQLRLHIPNNFISYNYFFEKISPQWLEVLKDEGFFKNPPEPDYNDERGTIGFPVWPESRCLVRMAKISPEVVLNIVTQIPDTDNVRVREDLINIACALPPELAKQIAEKESTWINSQRHLFFLFPNLA